ncbi:MAG: hypothetical protein M1827_007138 [Pycnora praestabilis]|nr:MAG: hypothetical protein M1827_007138 [Pycnora praestabilis]
MLHKTKLTTNLLVVFFILFFLCSFLTARRRRRAGLTPYRGTGWAAGKTPPGHAPATYTGTQEYGNSGYNNPAPPYSPPPAANGYYGNNGGYGGNQGYFNGQQNGIELQQPQSSYQPARGGDPVYDAPQGPPPGKVHNPNDGIIR